MYNSRIYKFYMVVETWKARDIVIFKKILQIDSGGTNTKIIKVGQIRLLHNQYRFGSVNDIIKYASVGYYLIKQSNTQSQIPKIRNQPKFLKNLPPHVCLLHFYATISKEIHNIGQKFFFSKSKYFFKKWLKKLIFLS